MEPLRVRLDARFGFSAVEFRLDDGAEDASTPDYMLAGTSLHIKH